MKITEELIKLALPKGTKKITSKVLTNLGLWWDGNEYIIENIEIFEKYVWSCLDDSIKVNLLFDQHVEHKLEIDELKRNVERLEKMFDNLHITIKPNFGFYQ